MNIQKNSKLAYIIVVLLSLIGAAFIYAKVTSQGTNSEADYSGDISLVDDYDTNSGSRLTDYFKKAYFLPMEERTYSLISQDKRICYYDISFNPIYFPKYYKGDMSFFSASDKAAMNQKIEGGYYSNFPSMQICPSYAAAINLESNIKSGRSFEKLEYKITSDDTIPLILGYGYRSGFSLNQVFSGKAMIGNNVKYKVVGFLKRNATMTLNKSRISLNKYMIMPQLSIAASNSKFENEELLSIKCEGYIHYNSEKEYKTAILEVSKIKKETGYKYSEED